MPFTNQLDQNNDSLCKNILFLSNEGENIQSCVSSLCQLLKDEKKSILLVDGNLGVSSTEEFDSNLEKVLMDKAAISKAIRNIGGVSVLSGKARHTLSLKSKNFQHQFLSDLSILSGNFDKTIVALSSENTSLQELWLSWAEKKYLFFQTKNILLEKTAQFLHDYPNQIDGLISLNKNPHLSRLTWFRLKKIIPELPELILNIKQTVQK